jgi:uncharacterized protein
VKIVLDSNILVAAVATRGACAELFARVLSVHRYAVHAQILAEVQNALLEKFKVPPAKVEATITLLRDTATLLEAPPLQPGVCRDPDDDGILALAHAFGAEVLVTGDQDLLVLNPWEGIPIVRPREFWLLDRQTT